MEIYGKSIKINGIIYKMNGKWLGCIQPMCSASGAFLAGAFFSSKVSPFS